MAKKPSARTNRTRPDDTLNLTPLIDMVTCLMFFLLMFAAIMPVVTIDAPLPKVAETADEIRQAKDAKNKLEVMLYISPKGFEVKSDYGPDRSFPLATGGQLPYNDLHKYLVELKSKRPESNEITLMPSDNTPYDIMIQVMDASRELVKGDQGFSPLHPELVNKPESQQYNRLFPDVSIGGV